MRISRSVQLFCADMRNLDCSGRSAGGAVGRDGQVERDMAIGRTEAQKRLAQGSKDRAGVASELRAEVLGNAEDARVLGKSMQP